MIESDFYSTEAGRNHFRNQLQSIRYCVQEVRFEAARTRRRRPRSRPPRRAQTCNFDVLYAYLTCTNYDFRYDIQKGCALVQLAILAAPPRRRVLTRLVPPVSYTHLTLPTILLV